MEVSIKLIVGLGNPGVLYKLTRHNAGARAVEILAEKEGFSFKASRSFKSLLAYGKIQGQDVCLALPQTFMNLSGESVFILHRSKNIDLKDILIVYDDISLPLGKIRTKAKGSSGGHNGLASIIERLNTNNIARIRLGIGNAKIEEEISEYVLSRFNKEEKFILDDMLGRTVEAIETWVGEGIEKCMNQFNQK